MTQRPLIFIFIALACFGAAFILNFMTIFWSPLPETYLHYNDVRGIAVSHHGKLYTLNFPQQSALIEHFNRSLPEGKSLPKPYPQAGFDKIVIYRFGKPDIEVKPITFMDNNLIFSVSEWYERGYLRDISNGELKTIITSSYDP